MKKVSVCIILGTDYAGQYYSFERTGFDIVEKKAEFFVKDAPKEYMKVIDNVEVELLVCYRENCNEKLIESFKPIADRLWKFEQSFTDASLYNEMFKVAQHPYICILNPYVFLQEHWLTELIHYHETVSKSGVVGICHNFSEVNFLPTFTAEKEEFTKVFFPKNNLVNQNGICFFLKEYLNFVGAFDESPELSKNEINHFQLRAFYSGLQNYYIPNQTCLIIPQKKENKKEYSASAEYMKKSINEMKKAKNYYIPLT